MEKLAAWLEPIRAQLPADFSAADAVALQKAITDEALRRFEMFLDGVRAYQEHPACRDAGAFPVLWEKGTTRLLDYAPKSAGPAILVVPSLVNRFEILDIDPAHSFLKFLAAQGLRPLVVDWQAPGEEESDFSLSDYMTKRLIPVLDFIASRHGPCPVLGYCMGGLLTLALALMRPAQVKSLTLMATPWDFAVAGVGGVPAAGTPMGTAFLDFAEKGASYLAQIGFLPPEFLQAVFMGFQPIQILQKFQRFSVLSPDTEAARRFVLTEDWLNNGVPLSLKVSMETLRDWYRDNLTAKNEWRVAGVRIDPREINVPTYVLIAEKDRIVPPPSSRPLAEMIRGAKRHEPNMGHIGLMTGDAAPQEVWKPLVSWLFSAT